MDYKFLLQLTRQWVGPPWAPCAPTSSRPTTPQRWTRPSTVLAGRRCHCRCYSESWTARWWRRVLCSRSGHMPQSWDVSCLLNIIIHNGIGCAKLVSPYLRKIPSRPIKFFFVACASDLPMSLLSIEQVWRARPIFPLGSMRRHVLILWYGRDWHCKA